MKVVSAAGRCSGGTLPARQWICAAADRRDVVERLPKQRGEFALAPGHRGEARTRRPPLPGRGVEAEHGEAVPLELGLHRRGRMVVGKLQLDRA